MIIPENCNRNQRGAEQNRKSQIRNRK
jgi:hypothetical protein